MVQRRVRRILTPFQEFVRRESAGGVILLITSIIAFIWANSSYGPLYEAMKALEVGVSIGTWHLEKELIHWVNDGLMAIFFLMVGLEIKRELLVGELADRQAAMLPIVGALGGMVVPAAIYAAINRGLPSLSGWGVPMATDIAFALGIMMLLGKRVPLGLKVFLTALAIVDDLGAILVIAIFYTQNLAADKLLISLALWIALAVYGRLGGRSLWIFNLVGVVMWYFMLKSGVHATVAGVLLALTIPMRRALAPEELSAEAAGLFKGGDFEQLEADAEHLERLINRAQSPLHELEHSLERWVAYLIMPIFALFNAGFSLSDDVSLTSPIALGAFLGLIVGKLVGVTGFSWIAVRTGLATLPRNTGWLAMAGAGLLAGIGFTMALFIAALAFGDGEQLNQAKLGVLAASGVAAILGLVVLSRAVAMIPEEALED